MPSPGKRRQKPKPQRRSAKAVIMRDQEVLLLHRPCGRWDLPGGQIKPGEEVVDGLVREVAEETGLHVQQIEQLTAIHRRSQKSGHCLSLSFLCESATPLAPAAVELSAEHDGFAFVSLKQARKLNLPAHQHRALHAARKFL